MKASSFYSLLLLVGVSSLSVAMARAESFSTTETRFQNASTKVSFAELGTETLNCSSYYRDLVLNEEGQSQDGIKIQAYTVGSQPAVAWEGGAWALATFSRWSDDHKQGYVLSETAKELVSTRTAEAYGAYNGFKVSAKDPSKSYDIARKATLSLKKNDDGEIVFQVVETATDDDAVIYTEYGSCPAPSAASEHGVGKGN